LIIKLIFTSTVHFNLIAIFTIHLFLAQFEHHDLLLSGMLIHELKFKALQSTIGF